jgi:hypothetical protein
MPRTDKLSGYKTNVIATNGRISVVYHSTVIVEATPAEITLDTGGWRTVTTKRKMNQAARQFGLGYQVEQKNFKWFVRAGDRLFTLDRALTFSRDHAAF